MTTDPRTQLADAVSALVDPIRHAQTYELRAPYPGGGPKQEIRVHRTEHPSLLDQLALAAIPASTAADGPGNRIPDSRPAASLEAIYVLTVIERETASWLDHLGLTSRGTLAADLRGLVGVDVDHTTLKELAHDAHGWYSRARIATGWDTPAYQPPAPCPVIGCGQRGLRVQLEAKTARCIYCKSTWKDADGSLQVLAEHVRWYTDKARRDTGELERIAG